MKKILAIIVMVVVVLAIIYLVFKTTTQPAVGPTITITPAENSVFAWPISRAGERVTKKLFGTYVKASVPQREGNIGTGTVSPEKFSGYHTGVDFETFPEEQDTDVTVYAVCDGTLLQKKWASGYGGVAVESCQYNGQPITVIYGHVKLASVLIQSGGRINKGQPLAQLGKGYSPETDGERKHLHLGIHLDSVVNITGYVARKADLKSWLDFTKLNVQ